MSSTVEKTIAAWSARRTYRLGPDEAQALASKKASVAAILPARRVPDTFGPIFDVMSGLLDEGWLDELVVVTTPDDPAASIAAQGNATVLDESEPVAGAGPSLGKGDAVWRAVRRTRSDIIVLLDTDTLNFGRHFVTGLVSPLLADPDVSFVKGAFDRPLRLGELTLEAEGGRVTELVARPLLNLFFPELAGFLQPLAGEVALRRELFSEMHIPVGYGLEIAMLIDAWRCSGLDALAQADLGERHDPSQTLKALVPMAHSTTAAVLRRVDESLLRSLELLVPRGGMVTDVSSSVEERPPPL